MSKRLTALVGIALVAMLPLSFRVPTQADTPPASFGKQVAGFTLKDIGGHTVSLADFKDKKAVVVIFLGTECPINNLYLPRLAELHKEYAPKGVQFLAINANQQDTLEKIKAHARKYAIPFPILKDDGNRVADLLDARRTPEAFALDAGGTIRYQGRIDDQFGVGYKRPKPTHRDLAQALDEMLAGKKVNRPSTEVAGCLIGRVKPVHVVGAVTFTRDVAPILQQRCQECHRPGQIGPMPLMSYDDVLPWTDTIREVIEQRRMPPWHADPRFGKFANDRSLSSAERETLLAWLTEGTPKGEPKDLPPPREFVAGWTIGKPDMVFTMPKDYDVPAEAPKWGIPYKHIFVDTHFQEDRWIERAEAVAGALEVVHHIIIFVVPPGEKFFPGNPATPVLTGTAPGDMPLILPPGTAKKIPAGAQLVFQMHYTPNGKGQKDRSRVGLIFAKKPPSYRVLTEPIAYPPAVQIPANNPNFQVESEFEFKQDGRILSFMPHMHLRGKDFRYTAIYPDGKEETLLSVPRFDFNWQSIYRLAKPVQLPKGTKIHCLAHFDNSAQNPNNPDPSKTVYWGDQTWEEMMIGWIDYAYDQPAK